MERPLLEHSRSKRVFAISMIFKNIKCRVCGKTFSAKRNNGSEIPKFCSQKCFGRSKEGIPATKKQKATLLSYAAGEMNFKWKGGRKNWWRKQVLLRDDYTCQMCDLRDTTPGFMDVNHIKPKRDFPELEFDLDNGECLCPNCHRRVTLREKHFISKENKGWFKKNKNNN